MRTLGTASFLLLAAACGADSGQAKNPVTGAVTGAPAVAVTDAGSVASADAGAAPDGGSRSNAGGSGSALAPAAGDAGSASTTGVWRPFNDVSPWNTPIPENAALAPDSDALVEDFRTSSPFGEHLDINVSDFSIPVYYASADTPLVQMTCELGGEGFSGDNGSNATAQLPIPAGAAPDPASDHHLSIISADRKTEWGMWNTSHENGTWACSLGATSDLTGAGVRPYKPNNPTWYTSHGARACGFPLIAGLIRTEEIDAGKIEHALIVAYPHIRAGFYMSPASTAQARIGDDSISTRGIPCGGRIQLDPSLDLDSLGLSRTGRIVAEALQRYGAYVGDYSGALSLYAENAPAAQEHWRGVLDTYELSGKLDLGRFRVLAFGELTDDGNGG